MLNQLIDKFNFQMEWLDLNIEGSKFNGVVSKYHKPLINMIVYLKEDENIECEVEEFTFCEKIVAALEDGTKSTTLITEIFRNNDEDDEEISDNLKHCILEDIFISYKRYKDICTSDSIVSNLLALSLEFGIKDPTQNDSIVATHDNLKSIHDFVQILIDRDMVKESDIEQIIA